MNKNRPPVVLERFTDIKKIIEEKGKETDELTIKVYKRVAPNKMEMEFTFIEDPLFDFSLKQYKYMENQDCDFVKEYKKQRKELNDFEKKLINRLAFIDPKNYL